MSVEIWPLAIHLKTATAPPASMGPRSDERGNKEPAIDDDAATNPQSFNGATLEMSAEIPSHCYLSRGEGMVSFNGATLG